MATDLLCQRSPPSDYETSDSGHIPSELLPCQMSQLPLTSQTTPTELPKPTNRSKRTNTRIHSPNFYQSLKSRWKADSLRTDNISASRSKSPSLSDVCPQTHFNLETNQSEQQKHSSSSTDPLDDCRAAERSLQLGVAESISSKPMTSLIQSAPENLQTPTLSPDTTRGSCNNDLIPYVKPSPEQGVLSNDNRSIEAQYLISSEQLASMLPKESPVAHEIAIGGSKSNAASISRPKHGAGILSHFLLPSQMDGSISDNAKSEKMDIFEGLLHKNHLNFASRRSSISKVLKRPDSIDASTPLLFQGIWEKELEENERKWKRLARMSGSQPSSIYSSESRTEKEDNTQKHDDSTLVDKDLPMMHSSTRTSIHSKKSSRNFCQPDAVQLYEIEAQNDVLEKVWDSFKSEAEISLSDINCDGSLVGRFAGSFDPLGCSAEADSLALPPAASLSSYFDGVETPGNVDDRAEKPIGLGLFQCEQPPESSVSVPSDYCPITSPKLKKLSLLSNNPICSSLLGSSRSKRRPTGKPPSKATRTPNLEANSSSIDLSLLNAFPTPPCKPQTNQSSTSFSLKPLILPDPPRHNQAISAMPPTRRIPESINEHPYKDSTVINRHLPISTLKPSTSKLISFTPTSFSNRPRAQTFGRSPIPPPLNLRTMSPQRNSSHRQRPLTSNCSSSGNSVSGTVPPVPLLRAPNTAPLESRTNFECNNREGDMEPVHSYDLTRPTLASMNSKLTTCGLAPKRPSLLMRPSSRSPRMLGAVRTKETNLPAHFTSAHTAAIVSPEPCSPSRTTPPVGQSTPISPAHYPVDQAGSFSSPHTSVGSSTGTASSGSTVPSPATPTSLRMTYNSRIPPVPMHHHPLCSPSPHSPIQSTHPNNPRYMIIEQTPKYSTGNRVAPNTIKASRMYRHDLPKSKPSAEPVERVSYGMAL